jgi:hypothetical protein
MFFLHAEDSYAGAATGWGYATVKYDGATRQQLWAAQSNGPANRTDSATASALDGDGNVYV